MVEDEEEDEKEDAGEADVSYARLKEEQEIDKQTVNYRIIASPRTLQTGISRTIYCPLFYLTSWRPRRGQNEERSKICLVLP